MKSCNEKERLFLATAAGSFPCKLSTMIGRVFNSDGKVERGTSGDNLIRTKDKSCWMILSQGGEFATFLGRHFVIMLFESCSGIKVYEILYAIWNISIELKNVISRNYMSSFDVIFSVNVFITFLILIYLI